MYSKTLRKKLEEEDQKRRTQQQQHMLVFALIIMQMIFSFLGLFPHCSQYLNVGQNIESRSPWIKIVMEQKTRAN